MKKSREYAVQTPPEEDFVHYRDKKRRAAADRARFYVGRAGSVSRPVTLPGGESDVLGASMMQGRASPPSIASDTRKPS